MTQVNVTKISKQDGDRNSKRLQDLKDITEGNLCDRHF